MAIGPPIIDREASLKIRLLSIGGSLGMSLFTASCELMYFDYLYFCIAFFINSFALLFLIHVVSMYIIDFSSIDICSILHLSLMEYSY